MAALIACVMLAGCGRATTGALQRPGPQLGESAVVPRPALRGSPARASYAPWPGFGHDAMHSGAAPVVGPQEGRIRWQRLLEGAVVPGPAVGAGGVAYAASNGGVLHAIDVATGRDRWTFDGGGGYGSDLTTVPAVLPDRSIIWPGPRHTVFALSAAGSVRWRLRLEAQPLSPLRLDDGTLILADTAGKVTAADPHSGRPLWRLTLGAQSYSSPAAASDGTIYTTAGDALFAIRDGRVLWRVRARDISEVSPAVAPDGTIVFGANDSTQYGVSPDGHIRWRFRTGALTYSSAAATRDGLVLFGDHHGLLNILRARDGHLIGRHLGLGRTPTRRSVGIWTAPAVDRHHNVYFGTRPGHIYGFDDRGRQLFDIDTAATVDSNPALAGDGTLLIGSESGVLYAIE